jgi:hypothetical protein
MLLALVHRNLMQFLFGPSTWALLTGIYIYKGLMATDEIARSKVLLVLAGRQEICK